MTGERNVMAFCLLMINMSITTVVTMYIETFVTMAATQKNKFVAFFSVAFVGSLWCDVGCENFRVPFFPRTKQHVNSVI